MLQIIIVTIDSAQLKNHAMPISVIFFVWGVFLCIWYLCVCMHICLGMLRHMYTHGGLKSKQIASLYYSPPVVLKQDSLLNLELSDWLGCQRSKLRDRIPPHSAFMWVLGIWIPVLMTVWQAFYQLGHRPSICNFLFNKFGALLIMGKQYHRKQNQG